MGYEEVKYRWTGEDWSNAAAAKKAKDAGTTPLPKILVTPYGLSPFQLFTSGVEAQKEIIKARVYLATDTDEKKPLAAWDIDAGAEVMLPLELANFGQPGLRDQFYRKGQEWIPLPDSASGGTLTELCRSLYATKEPRFDVYHVFSKTKPDGTAKTDAEWMADAAVRDRVLSKLVGHWQNTDYHYEQWKSGASLSGDLALPLSGKTLAVVLSEPPPPPAPRPVTPAGDQVSGAAVTVDTAAKGGSEPPEPYNHFPDPLKVTLLRSYQDRKDGIDGAERNLIACFDKGANVWEAINKGMSWQDINSMVRVYQRMGAVDKTGALWRDHMKYFIRAYTYGIYAIELVYTDREKLKPYLDEITHRTDTPRLANASGFYQCMHGGTVGWREVSDTDQLHISVASDKAASTPSRSTDGAGGAPASLNNGAEGAPPSLKPEAPVEEEIVVEDCHIDETSFTADRNPDGTAVPAYSSGPKHFIQSQKKWIDIERPFAKLEEILSSPKDASKRPKTADVVAALDAWAKKRDTEAVSGEAGHKNAIELLHMVQKDASS